MIHPPPAQPYRSVNLFFSAGSLTAACSLSRRIALLNCATSVGCADCKCLLQLELLAHFFSYSAVPRTSRPRRHVLAIYLRPALFFLTLVLGMEQSVEWCFTRLSFRCGATAGGGRGPGRRCVCGESRARGETAAPGHATPMDAREHR